MAFHIHRRSQRRAALPFATPPAPVAPRHRSTLPALSPRKERAARFRWPRLPRGRAPPKTGAGRGRVAPGPPCPPAPLPMAAPAAGLLPPLRSFCCSPDGFFPSALLEARAICRLCSQKHCPPFLYVWRGTSRPRNHSRARRAPPSLLPRAAALAQAQLVKLFFCCDPPPLRVPFWPPSRGPVPSFPTQWLASYVPSIIACTQPPHELPLICFSFLRAFVTPLCNLEPPATYIHTNTHQPIPPRTPPHPTTYTATAPRPAACPALPCPAPQSPPRAAARLGQKKRATFFLLPYLR